MIGIIYEEDEVGIFYHNPGTEYCIGKYKSKERAKEILQDIITIKEFRNASDKITLSQDKLEFSNEFTNVYYLPEK